MDLGTFFIVLAFLTLAYSLYTQINNPVEEKDIHVHVNVYTHDGMSNPSTEINNKSKKNKQKTRPKEIAIEDPKKSSQS